MNDKIIPVKSKDHRLDEMNAQEENWQDAGQLLRLLVGRLLVLNHFQDPTLLNNLQVLHKALSGGGGALQLQKLINDISARIVELDGAENKTVVTDAGLIAAKDEQIKLICDVFALLLDNINFPPRFRPQIEEIKSIIVQPGEVGVQSGILTGITNLAEVLDDIFDDFKQDKKDIETYLKQLTSEIKSLDEGIVVSSRFHAEKQQAEASINSKVQSEVHAMESNMTTLTDLEGVKTRLQKSLGTIRAHMESFKQQEQIRNQRANEVTDMLGMQLRKMEQECCELKKQVLEKHEQILSDPLTGVRNRFAYEEAIKSEIQRFKRYARPVTLLVLDLDKFKELNDTHGHNIGDKALKFVSNILAGNIRSVDFLARYGGDEFVIIFPELALKEATITANKLCKVIASSQFEYEDVTFMVTISGGIAQLREDDTAESLFERADDALYLAKKRGRNRCETKLH